MLPLTSFELLEIGALLRDGHDLSEVLDQCPLLLLLVRIHLLLRALLLEHFEHLESPFHVHLLEFFGISQLHELVHIFFFESRGRCETL